LAVVSTVAPKLTSTCSEGANPRQERVTRDSAGPVSGARAHLGLAEVAVVAVVVPVDPAVGWVVAPAIGLVVGTDEALEEDAAAVWSALRDVQPVMARAATTTAVAMIRTGRMVIPPAATTLRAQDSSLPGPVTARPPIGVAATANRPQPGRDLPVDEHACHSAHVAAVSSSGRRPFAGLRGSGIGLTA
jgi:hypothetical protein